MVYLVHKVLRNEEDTMAEPIMETIGKRMSHRSYDGRPLSKEDRAKLDAYIKEETKNPFGLKVRLRILTEEESGVKLGTMGMISGAHTFIAGAVTQAPRGLTAYGYVLEKAILTATAMGLGTCWLAGTLDRKAFAGAIHLAAREWMPAVTPLGYPTEKRDVRNAIVRAVARSKKRKPWTELFFENNMDTTISAGEAGEYADALEMVRLGPSASNKQPWRIVKKGGAYHFFCPEREGVVPHMRHDHIDMGIAMCHFEWTARERGLSGQWVFNGDEISGLEYIATWVCG